MHFAFGLRPEASLTVLTKTVFVNGKTLFYSLLSEDSFDIEL